MSRVETMREPRWRVQTFRDGQCIMERIFRDEGEAEDYFAGCVAIIRYCPHDYLMLSVREAGRGRYRIVREFWGSELEDGAR